MNGEVTIEIAKRTGALPVPLDAVRTTREAPAVASVLGLDADALKVQVQRQSEALSAARTAARAGGGTPEGALASGVSSAGKGATGPARAAATDRRPGATGMTRGGRGAAASSTMTRGASGSPGRANRSNTRLVVVQTAAGLEPRVIRIGISDFDRAEVVSGLAEGDQVVLLGVAEQVAKRRDQQAQLARRVGNGLPGSASTGGAARGAGGGR
jgi:hypothetical protein